MASPRNRRHIIVPGEPTVEKYTPHGGGGPSKAPGPPGAGRPAHSAALTKALESQEWDPSVKSLVNFPQVLTMMSEKLDWTQKLGDAFLEDKKKVMDTIQSLRAKAQASGNLKTTKEQTVIVEEKIIKIEQASPQVIYVPTYNPTVVYGAWPYPAYPTYYYYPP